MQSNSVNSIAQFIEKEKWSRVLECLLDVLRINVFVVDKVGRPVLTSHVNGYGWRLLVNMHLGSLAQEKGSSESGSWIADFVQNGDYLERKDSFGLHSFAIPLKVSGEVLGYIVVGPVIFNRRQEVAEYRQNARKYSVKFEDLMTEIEEIRVISYLDLKAVLDLLAETFQYFLDLKFSQRHLVSRQLRAFLDAAINLAQAENGSLMLLEAATGTLVIRAAKGLPESRVVSGIRIRLGEGIAGLAAQKNEPFLIQGSECPDNRIQGLLKRPEIKSSLVVPLESKGAVFGVLSVHTQKNGQAISENAIQAIQNLSEVLSSVVS